MVTPPLGSGRATVGGALRHCPQPHVRVQLGPRNVAARKRFVLGREPRARLASYRIPPFARLDDEVLGCIRAMSSANAAFMRISERTSSTAALAQRGVPQGEDGGACPRAGDGSHRRDRNGDDTVIIPALTEPARTKR